MVVVRLSAIFVATLAISVIISATATWGLTYTTSYAELRDMANGFVGLATGAVDDFAKLVWQLIADSGTLVSGILDTEYQRSMTQLNETGQQFLSTTMDLMARAKNTTSQAQGMVATLVLSFGTFMGSVIADFKAVGTDYASRLRTESASRTQAIFSSLLQDRVLAIQRLARMYEMNVVNLSRRADQPFDDGSCTLLGLLCAASKEISNDMFIATEGGNMMLCDLADVAYALLKRRGPTADVVSFYQWPPYIAGTDFAGWKASCMAGYNNTFMNDTCPHSNEKEYPVCNATCGYDPRCRPWYNVHYTTATPRTQMSAVYIDVQKNVPVVTLSYPIYSISPRAFVGVAATDFFFSDVNNFLATLSSGAVSQRVAVVFNSSDLLVVGSNVACATSAGQASGVGIFQVCDPVMRGLGDWLAANRGLVGNASLELAGTLWDVFPGTVDSFSYFVAVGMNKTEVYAVITAVSQEANTTLRAMSQQQSSRMAQLEAASLAEMDAVSTARIASLQALQAQEQRHMLALRNQTALAFNASRQKSADDLSHLISSEMGAIDQLENYHLTQVKKSIGTTFGAVVGIFLGILLLGAYGTWAVAKQVEHIAQVMEDVAEMRVEQLEVSDKGSIREVQRIGLALGVLVARLAEYKSYMPAALFQPETAEAAPEGCPTPSPMNRPKHSMMSAQLLVSRRDSHHSALSGSSSVTGAAVRRGTTARAAPVASNVRLLRRSVSVLAVNVVQFQGEMAQRSAAQLEGMLNRLVATVHGMAAKAQGNVDAILGDQLLVTFNAHFACSDPPIAAAAVALDVIGALRGDAAFGGRVQVGVAAGAVFTGHLGYASFKAMVALGAPMKVASLLSHLSGFNESVAVVCPAVEERIKYHFTLQPADLVSLPSLGESVTAYAKSVTVYLLEARAGAMQEDEWLYQICPSGESSAHWAEMFGQVCKAHALERARADLEGYVADRPKERLAQRLLSRLAYWQPRVGIVLAERPDVPGEPVPSSPTLLSPTALEVQCLW